MSAIRLDGADKRNATIEKLLNVLVDDQYKDLERRYINLNESCERMSKRLNNARQVILKIARKHNLSTGNNEFWTSEYGEILDAVEWTK